MDRTSMRPGTSRRPLTARGVSWAVATPHHAASEAAADALTSGGNAVDAAIAAAAVLTVVYPNQCSLGGDVFALVAEPDGVVHAVNGSGAAPAQVEPDAILAQYGVMPTTGALTVTVPGALSAWDLMSRRWGRKPVAAALDRAASLARSGVRLAAGVARDLALEADHLEPDPGMRDLLFVDGSPMREGDLLSQPALAGTMETLRDEGVSAFYDGDVGYGVVTTLRAMGSAMSMDDFRRHETTVHTVVGATFRQSEYLTTPPNSQGAYFLAGLRAAEGLEERFGRALDPAGGDAGLLARLMSQLAHRRDLELGDAAVMGARVADLLSDASVERLAQHVLDGVGPRPGEMGAPTAAQSARRSGDTVAISVADSDGTWVSLIQSVFHAFGSGVLDPHSGVILQNRGSSFSLEPGSTNRLGPMRRPLHTLMPVLVRKEGRVVGAHGTMGGRAQPQIHTQLVMSGDIERDPLAAIAGPRWILGSMEAGRHGTVLDERVSVESGITDVAEQSLEDAGFAVLTLPEHDDGAGHVQVVRSVDGELVAASDPRADGSALAG